METLLHVHPCILHNASYQIDVSVPELFFFFQVVPIIMMAIKINHQISSPELGHCMSEELFSLSESYICFLFIFVLSFSATVHSVQHIREGSGVGESFSRCFVFCSPERMKVCAVDMHFGPSL